MRTLLLLTYVLQGGGGGSSASVASGDDSQLDHAVTRPQLDNFSQPAVAMTSAPYPHVPSGSSRAQSAVARGPGAAAASEGLGGVQQIRLSTNGSNGLECLLAACQLAVEQEASQAPTGPSLTQSLPTSTVPTATAFVAADRACTGEDAPMQLDSASGSGGDGVLEAIAEASDADGETEAVGGGAPTTADNSSDSPWADVDGPTASACAPKNRRHKSKVGLG